LAPACGTRRAALATDEFLARPEVRAIGPDSGKSLDDLTAVVLSLAPVTLQHGVPDEGGHGRAPPPAFRGEEARHLLVEVELRPFHR
jgi:hypothetical protein